MKSKKVNVDIYVPVSYDKNGFEDIFNDAYNKLLSMGYNPKREKKPNTHYKILLEPYPMDHYFSFKFDYRIKFKYSALSAKPDPVYSPTWNLCYDAILCFGIYEADYLKVYSETHIIDNLKYINFKRNKNTDSKPTVLYLPTYGNESSVDYIIDSIRDLKREYKFITKLHHGTSFLKDENNRVKILRELSDECYDQNRELIELLSYADVVLSDNSGSIFEAIYAKIPVAVFADNINTRKLGEFNTTQYDLINKGYIPYTNNPKNITKILKEALSEEYIDKQKEIRDKLFVISDNPSENFYYVINQYLNDNINYKYKQLHDVLAKDYYNKAEDNKRMEQKIAEKNNLIKELKDDINSKEEQLENLYNSLNSKEEQLENSYNSLNSKEKHIEELKKVIYYYENGKLYNISKKIYSVYNKLFRRK